MTVRFVEVVIIELKAREEKKKNVTLLFTGGTEYEGGPIIVHPVPMKKGHCVYDRTFRMAVAPASRILRIDVVQRKAVGPDRALGFQTLSYETFDDLRNHDIWVEFPGTDDIRLHLQVQLVTDTNVDQFINRPIGVKKFEDPVSTSVELPAEARTESVEKPVHAGLHAAAVADAAAKSDSVQPVYHPPLPTPAVVTASVYAPPYVYGAQAVPSAPPAYYADSDSVAARAAALAQSAYLRISEPTPSAPALSPPYVSPIGTHAPPQLVQPVYASPVVIASLAPVPAPAPATPQQPALVAAVNMQTFDAAVREFEKRPYSSATVQPEPVVAIPVSAESVAAATATQQPAAYVPPAEVVTPVAAEQAVPVVSEQGAPAAAAAEAAVETSAEETEPARTPSPSRELPPVRDRRFASRQREAALAM